MSRVSQRKVRVGTVIGDKMDKTVIVEVKRVGQHPRFKRTVRRFKKYMVHDESNACKVGDVVSIMETRPLSKEKCWRVLEVLKKQG